MLVPAVEALSTSPAKKLPIETVAPASAVLSESPSVSELISETDAWFDAAGLSVLSVKVGLSAVIESVGALSRARANGAAPFVVDRKRVGVVERVPPTRPPT